MIKIAEMIWRIGFDANEAKRAGKEFKSSAGGTTGGGKKSGSGAFAGGLIGGLLGGILSSVRQLVEPIQAMSTLLVAALFPIFKPFLILFLKVGLMLFKFFSTIANGYEKLAGDDSSTAKDITTGAGAVTGGVIGAALGGPWGAGIGAAIGAAIGGIIPSAFKGIGNILTIAAAWLDELLGVFGIDMDAVRRAVVTFIYETIPELWDKAVEAMSGVWEYLAGLGQWMWDKAVAVLTVVWEYLAGLGQWMWDGLVAMFTLAWEAVSGIGQWIFDTLSSIMKSGFSVLSGIGNLVWKYVKSLLKIGKDDKKSGSDSSINDAIITPNGDIIRTSPSDYLIATKNPQSLGGQSRASSINVSINGGLITEDVARKIGQIILKEVKRSGA